MMFTRNNRGERRVSPSAYKVLLTTHILVSVGWLGVVIAKSVLGLLGLTTDNAGDAAALFRAMEALNIAFPPVAIGTIVSGVLLSVGTKWGLLDHYWVVTKIVLTVGIIGTAVQLGSRLTERRLAALAGQETGGDFLTASTTLLLALTLAHLLMLIIATILSTYKPWGKTRLGRRTTLRRPEPRATLATPGRATAAQRAGE